MPSRSADDLNAQVAAHITAILHPDAVAQDESKTYNPFDLTSPSPQLAASIDHTLLKPDATPEQIEKVCREAVEYGFKSVCVNPIYIPLVASLLPSASSSSGPIPCSVIGFPLGASQTSTKVHETRLAIAEGAKEIDMVLPVGLLKAKNYVAVHTDILSVVEAAKSQGVPVKVIFETALLTTEEKVAACWLSADAGAKFVKTCTGFGGGGATVADVKLMRRAVEFKGDGVVEVKASGGVRDFEGCVEMLRAGATRVGASAGVLIMKGQAGGKGAGY